MDQRLVGTWYKEELGETLYIFDETPLRMKMSFSSSGFFNVEPNCVYEENRDLCFEINDEYNRMVYHVHVEGECLRGYYTRFGNRTEVVYRRLSDTPDDLPYEYRPTEVYVPESDKTRLEVLREYAAYDRERPSEPYATDYVLNETLPPVLEAYEYSRYMADADPGSDEVAFRLLAFVCDHFRHDGTRGLPNGRRVEDIVAFCESHDMKVNCRGLAILLATLLRMRGIPARHITCKPFEDPFEDCHVVVDCLLPSGKRIMLDPTSRLYYTDRDGAYVSLERLRAMLISDEPLFPNADASYNGGAFDAEYNRAYMVKNTFRFSRGTHYANGSDERGPELIPKGYDTSSFSARAQAELVHDDRMFWRMD